MKKSIGITLIVVLSLSLLANAGLVVWLAQKGMLPTGLSSGGKVIARIEGKTLLEKDLMSKAPNVQKAKEQLYRIKRQAADQWIAEQAIEFEAKRLKMDVGQFIQKLVLSLQVQVADPEIDAVIQQFGNVYPDPKDPNKKGPLPRAQARQYLMQMKQQQALRKKIDEIKAAYKHDVYLMPPETPRVKQELALANRPYSGNSDAKVKIVEFADFQCSACSYFYKSTLSRIKDEYGDKVMIVFRDFPLPQHKDAYLAAIASKCAGQQGKFWEYHDLLFEKQPKIKREDLIVYAKGLDLNHDNFTSCLEDSSVAKLVDEDVKVAKELGIDATPTLYINGEKLHSLSYETLKEKIDHHLQ